MLRVTDLHVGDGDMEAVRGVSFEVQPGEAVAILGANGAGKTTILKALMGLVPTAAGAIELDGRPLGETPGWERAARGLAWVPEGRRLFATFTVEENLRADAYPRRDRAAVAATSSACTGCPPPSASGRGSSRRLSVGEQQMCAIGRALMAAPRLLLIDEASRGLAPILVRHVHATIAELVADGLTLLLVEQNARQALLTVRGPERRPPGRPRRPARIPRDLRLTASRRPLYC